MKVFRPGSLQDLDPIIEEVSQRVKEIEVVKLNETENLTQLLVFIRTAEPPHYHAEHDLTFILIKGHGELYLDGKRERLSEGDVAFIPKGKVHFYTNTSGKVHFYTNTSVVSVLLANFSPRYDGKDSIKVQL